MRIHHVPTHLTVEDRLLAGLTVRQALLIAISAALGYWLWQHALWPFTVRLALLALVSLSGLAITLLRPAGYSLAFWLFVVLSHALLPHRTVWHGADDGLISVASDQQQTQRAQGQDTTTMAPIALVSHPQDGQQARRAVTTVVAHTPQRSGGMHP